MANTKASEEFYVLDVPEADSLKVKFTYNFFVSDESVNENFVSNNAINTYNTMSELSSRNFLKRIPRYVELNFSSLSFNEKLNFSSQELNSKENIFIRDDKNLISKNLTKIILEDNFTNGYFSSLQFKSGEVQQICADETSSTLTQLLYDKYYKDDISNLQKSRIYSSLLDKTVNSSFVIASLSVKDEGQTFSSKTAGGSLEASYKKTSMEDIVDVFVHGQINNKLSSELIAQYMINPFTPTALNSKELYEETKKIKSSLNTIQKMPELPFVKVMPQSTSSSTTLVRHVGYVIDKIEILKNKTEVKKQIVIESTTQTSYVDFNVKYGSTYMYSIRTIFKVELPVYDETTDKIVFATILISSRPASVKYIKCAENVPPPPPTDFTFHWRNEDNKLMLTWTFPLNTQNDIKKFQVFRRKSINDPFELIKQYDFNDSSIKINQKEIPGPNVNVSLKSPRTYFVDEEFTKNSKFIYAVASTDAHELTSNYSDQFEVIFDSTKNMIKKRLISHSGAPKQYPNMYLEKDLFVDTIKISHKKKMYIGFTPDYYEYVEKENMTEPVFLTKQKKGSYKINLINLDNQKDEIITVEIDDKRRDDNNLLNNPLLNLLTKNSKLK